MSSLSGYPDADRLDLVEVIHGRAVADPYRWLEDAESAATKQWSQVQEAQWRAWADRLVAWPALRRRLDELVPGFTGAPHVVGEHRFWMDRAPGADHAVLRVDDAGGARPLVDPNVIGPDGTVTLDGWSPSPQGDRLAYQLSSGGDEESRIWIMDVATGAVLDGPIDRVRYSPLAWLPDGEELIYVRRLAPELVAEGESQYHRRVYRHRLGEPPENDVEVFGSGAELTAYFGADVSADGRWLAVTTSLGTAPRNDLHLLDLHAPGSGVGWEPVLVGVDAQAAPHFDRRGILWLSTDLDAPRGRLCALDLDGGAYGPEHWREVVGEDADGAVLEGFVLAGERLVVVWRRHAISEVTIHDRSDGALISRVPLPGAGSVDLTGRRDEEPEVWVGYTDDTHPYRVYALDLAAATLHPAAGPAGDSVEAGEGIVSQQLVATSADGTSIRLTVVAGGSAPDRPRPTVLYGYGGFGVSLTPGYSSSIRAWVEAGGVWVVAHLRGGSEEGEQWHRDGMREHKHHVFEDFEAASDLLVDQGWTTRPQLGIYGGSNGGLLVGAALTRSPERYAAVVCSAPLLDMVRYERFGLGATWNDEFGTAADPTELGWLLDMSPYHHVEAGTAYPSVLFTIFESDSRVDPLHARKLAAALQWATTSDPQRRPILVRSESEVGHGARSLSRTLDLASDQLAYLGDQLGLDLGLTTLD